jgi:acetyl esterase
MEINLDPELQALVDAGIKQNPNPPHAADVPIEMLRAGYVMISKMQSTADIVCGSITDFEIPGPAGPLGARAYMPRASEQGPQNSVLPALIFIHGGGFMIGDLDSHDSVCRQLANVAGVKVIALDYRLAPEHKFPAAVDDCLAACAWIHAQAASLGINPDKIAIGGDSAGGNLSAVVCNHFANHGGPQLAFQLLIYPGIDGREETESRANLREGVTLDTRILEYFSDGYTGGVEVDPGDARIVPSNAPDLSQVPPAHVITAEYDPLRDEGRAYADQLNAAGVAASYRCYPGLMHNFILTTAFVSSSRQAIDDMALVLKEALA